MGRRTRLPRPLGKCLDMHVRNRELVTLPSEIPSKEIGKRWTEALGAR